MVMVLTLLSPYNTFYLTTVTSSDFSFPFTAIKRTLTLQARSAYHQTRAGKWPGCTKSEGEEKTRILPNTSLPVFVRPFFRSLFLLLAIDDLGEYFTTHIQFTYLANTEHVAHRVTYKALK